MVLCKNPAYKVAIHNKSVSYLILSYLKVQVKVKYISAANISLMVICRANITIANT